MLRRTWEELELDVTSRKQRPVRRRDLGYLEHATYASGRRVRHHLAFTMIIELIENLQFDVRIHCCVDCAIFDLNML